MKMEVTIRNIKSVMNSKIAFNGATGRIFAKSKQAAFFAAMEKNGYEYNVWATANNWGELGLTIKGAKGKGLQQKVFITPGSNAEEKTEYRKHLEKYLAIKAHNDKVANGEIKGRKHFNPYHEIKGKGLILSVWYFNVAEVKYKDGEGSPVDIIVPQELTSATVPMLAVHFESETPALPNNMKDVDDAEIVDAEVIDAEIINDETESSDTDNADLVKENAALRAEIEQLRKEKEALKKALTELAARI